MWKLFGGSRRRAPEPSEEESYEERLNRIETTLERLQLDSAERQVAVLNAVEKTMTQLRAREAKRAREIPSEDDVQPTNGDGEVSLHPPRRARPTPTAHLANRLRRF